MTTPTDPTDSAFTGQTPDLAPAGWHADPAGPAGTLRHWTGKMWTEDRIQQQSEPGLMRLAMAVAMLLLVSGVVAAAGAAEKVWAYQQVGGWIAHEERFTTAAAQHVDLIEGAFAGAEVLLMLITAIVFVVWQGKTYVSACIDRGELRRGRALSLWSWVIPVVYLWWPLQNIRDLSWGAEPVSARTGIPHRSGVYPVLWTPFRPRDYSGVVR